MLEDDACSSQAGAPQEQTHSGAPGTHQRQEPLGRLGAPGRMGWGLQQAGGGGEAARAAQAARPDPGRDAGRVCQVLLRGGLAQGAAQGGKAPGAALGLKKGEQRQRQGQGAGEGTGRGGGGGAGGWARWEEAGVPAARAPSWRPRPPGQGCDGEIDRLKGELEEHTAGCRREGAVGETAEGESGERRQE